MLSSLDVFLSYLSQQLSHVWTAYFSHDPQGHATLWELYALDWVSTLLQWFSISITISSDLTC